MHFAARVGLACACLLGGCVRHPALDPCGRPVPAAPPPTMSARLGREYDARLESVRAGRLVVEVYTRGEDRPGGVWLQTPTQVSLTAHFAQGFVARVWRAATDSTQPAVLDSVWYGQYVLAVAPARARAFRSVVRIRLGYTDSVRVEFPATAPTAISCSPP